MSSTPLIKEISINAPVERVWRAITTKEEMSKWSFEIADFEPVVGFKFTFMGENDCRQFIHLCEVKEVIKNKKLSYSWSYEDLPDIQTLVTIELFAEDDNQTKVVLTHEGLEKFPQDKDFALGNFQEGWNQIIGKQLKEFVESNAG